jgi:hypothetical protein
MQYSAASAANRARENATKQWLSYQKQKARIQNAKDEQNRSKAQAAQEESLNKLGDMPGTVGEETQRLTTDLNTGNPDMGAPLATSDALLSGQGDNPSFKEYAAKQLNKAAKDARNKTAALAAMQAYTGSQFGMQNMTNQALQQGNQMIDLYNNNRRGDLAVYGLAKGIQPLQVGEASGGIGNALAQLGGAIGGMGGGGSLSSIF